MATTTRRTDYNRPPAIADCVSARGLG